MSQVIPMLDTTIGGDKANSYCSVADADQYYTADPRFNEVWGALGESEKESWLRLATRSIDSFDTFRGLPQYDWQALAFPRVLPHRTYPSVRGTHYPAVPERKEGLLKPDEIPAVVKKAQLEMAAFLVVHKTGPGVIDTREISNLSLLNGLVQLTYTGTRDREVEAAGGGVLERVKALLKEVVAPVRWSRV